MKTFSIIILILSGAPLVRAAPPAPVVWNDGPGHNGHTYQVFTASEGIEWTLAEANAIQLGGHLVSITSAEEMNFVAQLTANVDEVWAIDRFNNTIGPWIGGLKGAGAWQWSDGEAFSYTNWGQGQPSLFVYDAPEDRIHFWKEGAILPLPTAAWNDYPSSGFAPNLNLTQPKGYIVEWSSSLPEVPATGLQIHTAVEVTWPTVIGSRYQIQFSEDNQIWLNAGDPLDGTGGILSWLDRTRGHSRRFYRIATLTP